METLFQLDDANQSSNSTSILSATDFFIDNNPNGYMSKSELKSYAKSLLRREPNDFVNLIEEIKKGTKFNWDMRTRKDRAGREYAYPQFF